MKKLILLLFSLTFACSGVKVTGVKKADGFSITHYKTFNFYDVEASGDAISSDRQANLKLIKEAITKQLALKGVVPNAENPDLRVNIGVVVNEEIQTRATDFSNPADRAAYMGQRNYTWQSQIVEVGSYREGTVTVDLVDHASNKLVWQGSAESVLPEKEKNVPSLIEEGMGKLFAKLQ